MVKMSEAEVRLQLTGLGLNPSAVAKYTVRIMAIAKREECPLGVVLECYRLASQLPYRGYSGYEGKKWKQSRARHLREYEALNPSDQVAYRISHNFTWRPLKEWINNHAQRS